MNTLPSVQKLFSKIGAILAALLVIAALSGCNLFDTTAFTNTVKYTLEEQKKIIADMTKLVTDKADLYKILEVYKSIIEFEPANSENRQKALRYMLDESLKMVDTAPEEAIKFAQELSKIIPGDFYIQNRIIGGYVTLAKRAIDKKEWETATDYLANKALHIRFDSEAMRAYLTMQTLRAKDEIAAKNIQKAKDFLGEVISIARIKDNITIFPDERLAAEKLFKSIGGNPDLIEAPKMQELPPEQIQSGTST